MFCNRAISRAWTGGYLVTINKLERLDWGSQPHQRTDAQNDSFFLASFRTTFDFDGDPTTHESPLLLLLFLLLGDTTFWRTQNERSSRHHGYSCFPPDPSITQNMS